MTKTVKRGPGRPAGSKSSTSTLKNFRLSQEACARLARLTDETTYTQTEIVERGIRLVEEAERRKRG